MSIKIDKRSKYSTYVETGNLTIYIEHSPGCAEDYVHVWEKDSADDVSIFWTSFNYNNNKRILVVNNEQV
tara:strand:+ start:922 stop:1131 length:210 start_codon:yes stop_codon:yes gene_type:complete